MNAPNPRIGILTLHYGFNEGAILQAYALAGLFRQHLPGAQVEIVDQRYPSKLTASGNADGPRTAALQQAIDNWLPLGALRLRTNDSAQAKAALPGRYDLLVYGSDQVWCLRYQRRLRALFGRGILPRQVSPFLPAYPNIYWPDERLPIPQVSFAAAVGSLQWGDIPRRHQAAMRRGFMACRLISVRDERTMRFLDWLGGDLASRAAIVPDPTFAEPFRTELSDPAAQERVRERLAELGVDFSRPRCGIVSSSGVAERALVEHLRKAGVQTIGITTRNDFCDVNLFEHGFHPLDWARVFRNMDFCVSERMHACICCLLQGTPFVALDINVVAGDPDTKLRSLMHGFGVDQYCLPKRHLDAARLIESASDLQRRPWDWEKIAQRVSRLSEVQIGFLNRISSLLAAA
jgi:hypothetical protein